MIVAARIEQTLGHHRDVATLTAFGAAQVVLGHVDQGIQVFEEAKALRPEDPSVLIDLSAAYFEKSRQVRAEAAAPYLGKALDAAARATRTKPDAPEAWFNLAIVQQEMGMAAGARATWNEFLRVERDAAWAEEGRRQIAALEAR